MRRSRDLAGLVAATLNAACYDCEISPEGTDQAVDIIAGTGLLGLSDPESRGPGLLVAWGGITREARRYLSTQRFAIKVRDSSDVLDKLFGYYRELPADVRRDLPLKQVWTIAVESE